MIAASALRGLASVEPEHTLLRAVLVVAVAIAVAFASVPLRDAIARKREDVARNRLVLEVARARSAESAALARSAPPAASGDVRRAIDRVLAAEGLRYAPVDAQAGDGVQRVVIEAAPFDRLVRALDTLMREDGVRVRDASLTARVEPGSVRAELAFAR